jgi:hypothetical protein
MTYFDGIEEDSEAEGEEEDCVGERAQDLGPGEAERVLGPAPLAHAHRDVGDEKRQHVGQHVEGVGDERVRLADAAHDQLDAEEEARQHEHEEEASLAAEARAAEEAAGLGLGVHLVFRRHGAAVQREVLERREESLSERLPAAHSNSRIASLNPR